MDEIILQNKNGQIVVSSRDVAEKFGKRHTHVLDTIKGYSNDLSTAEFSALFDFSEYKASNGKTNYEYLMNRDGFSLLAMGFTGKDALKWKLKYIEAFNKMEETLKSQSMRALPTTYKEALLQLLEEVEKNEQLENERKVLLPKADYHDEVLNKNDLITTTVVAKDLGLRSAAKLNQILYLNKIMYKNGSGTWCPYADYEWLISDGYADYASYTKENASPCLKWTEKGRKWIIENYSQWVMNLEDE